MRNGCKWWMLAALGCSIVGFGADKVSAVGSAEGGIACTGITVPQGQMWAFTYQNPPDWVVSMSAGPWHNYVITPTSWCSFGASVDYHIEAAFDLRENDGLLRCWDYGVKLQDTDNVVKTIHLLQLGKQICQRNGFEHLDVGSYDSVDICESEDSEVYFATAGDNPQLQIRLYEGDVYNGVGGYPIGFSGVGEKNLAFKTRIGNPIYRTVNPIVAGSSVLPYALIDELWLDMVVKLTAFDEHPEWPMKTNLKKMAGRVSSEGGVMSLLPMGAAIGIDDKMLLYYFEDEETEQTSLWLLAGRMDGSSSVPVLERYELSVDGNTPLVDKWHRVTIQAAKDETSGIMGFHIYIDGKPASSDGKTVFPAYGAGTVPTDELSYIAFDGQGSVDDIAITTEVPDMREWWVTFDLGEHGTRIGGGELEQAVLNGTAAVAPEVEAQYGWEFVRWDKDFSCVTGPLTVTAVWQRMKWPVVVTNPDGTETTVDVEHEAKQEFVAPAPTVDMDGTRQIVALGTTYTAPEVTNRFEVTVTNGFAFVWDILQTNFWFAVGEAAHGAVQSETDGWKSDETAFTLTAVADEHCHLVRWTGDADGCVASGNTLSVVMDRPRTIGAAFALNEYEEKVGAVVWSYVLQDGVAIVSKEDGAAVSGEVAGEVVVPATLGGYPVRAIGAGAFSGCGDVVTIVLPQNLVEVGEGAFAGCSNLVSVVLPKGVTAILPQTFEGCAALEELVIPAGVQTIGEEAFAGCASLKAVEIPEGVTEIAVRMFAGCEKLSSVKLPESLERIGAEAFVGCAALGSVTIPANVSEIGENAFGECKGLGSVRFYGQPPTGIWTSGLVNEKVTIHGPADVTISPADRTVFGTDLAVTLATSWAGGVVRYTLDGSAPTAESPAFDGISVHNKTTVRAATFVEGLRWSEIAEATYGVGKVTTPTATSTQGGTFYHNGNVITLDCATAGVEIRYTFGGEPTANSTLYTGPFEISRTTTVKAKAFGHPDYVDSDVMTAEFVRVWEGLATPAISPEGGLIEAECELVTIACESEDVTIYYTLDGSRPSATNGRVYTEPFKLYQSGKVNAIATKFDWADSEVASVTFMRGDQLGEALNYFGAKVTNDANAPWTVDAAESHDGVSAVRSAAVEGGMSGIKLTVKGAGRLSFWWKASCEEVWDGDYYDYGIFAVGSDEKARIAGQTDWQRVVIDLETTGKHTLHWDYAKDDDNDEGKDCIWVDQVVWVPADGSGVTLTTGEPVPYAWLEGYGLGVMTDFETAANAKTGKRSAFGKELTVWEDYVTGTNPTNLDSVFRTFIDLSGGTPKISWEPDLNENGTRRERVYQVWGAKSLDGQWLKVDGDEEKYNFFTTTVGLP